MTIAELHSNEELRRHEFPIVRETTFLAHAGDCPLPRRVQERIAAQASASTLTDQEAAFPGERLRQLRLSAARLLNAQMDEIAFVASTSAALRYGYFRFRFTFSGRFAVVSTFVSTFFGLPDSRAARSRLARNNS